MTLQVKNWRKHYEIAKSKQIKRLEWVAIPNSQNIKYIRLVERHKSGAAHFGVFIAIVQMLSKHHIDTRHGYLTDNGSKDSPALSIEDIADLIKMPLATTKEAIGRLLQPNIAWLIDEDTPTSTDQVPTEYPTGQDITEQDTTGQSKKIPQGGYLTKNGKVLTKKYNDAFNLFWKAFDYPKAKAAAADSWFNINWPEDSEEKNKLFTEIIKAAKREALDRPWQIKQGNTPKYPQGWLTERRWEDE